VRFPPISLLGRPLVVPVAFPRFGCLIIGISIILRLRLAFSRAGAKEIVKIGDAFAQEDRVPDGDAPLTAGQERFVKSGNLDRVFLLQPLVVAEFGQLPE